MIKKSLELPLLVITLTMLVSLLGLSLLASPIVRPR